MQIKSALKGIKAVHVNYLERNVTFGCRADVGSISYLQLKLITAFKWFNKEVKTRAMLLYFL